MDSPGSTGIDGRVAESPDDARPSAADAVVLGSLPPILARLEIPRVLFTWPRAHGGVEVQLGPETFWRTVRRVGLAVTSLEQPGQWFPYRHAFIVDGLEFFTFSTDPVLPPGVLTPGYALRLT
jgi:hypothetical protein